MFIAFKKSDRGYHIDRFRMDGTGRTHVIEQGLLGPITLFYEFGLNRVFWADAGSGSIESTSVEGDDRHSFRSLHTNPISLASLNRDIFWTNEKSNKLFWTDKQNTNYNRKIVLDLPDSIDSVYVVSAASRQVTFESRCRILIFYLFCFVFFSYQRSIYILATSITATVATSALRAIRVTCARAPSACVFDRTT